MTYSKLTLSELAAKLFRQKGARMNARGQTKAVTALMLGSAILSGCITVNAPSEPIVIELNINITAEVVYQLAEDAGQTIEDNSGIF
jgi:hypothetical protein